MRLGLKHSYFELPGKFYRQVVPTPVADPQLVVFNDPLATAIGLDAKLLRPVAAAMLSGNDLPEDAQPIAMAYAGHQFGGFSASLGDGRAILLGELQGPDGVLRDLQLKGAGLTPFSRGGDGRAAIGPMLREYLISEGMHAFGIPTTRSLAVVTTGEHVFRQGALRGAVLARVAASHIRVGTFQYFAARGEQDAVQELLNYVIDRHYPQAREAAVPALAVLQAVCQRQAVLIAQWMLVGFIHGVMNTDNMAVSGETIDYGPCAFMDSYDPNTVFSSIDHGGRYAYANQPAIAQWNLSRFAETLLPLIDAETEKAVGLATQALASFAAQFEASFLDGMRRKTGLTLPGPDDAALTDRLLTTMQESAADFTLSFRALALAAEDPGKDAALCALFSPDCDIGNWLRDWRVRLGQESASAADRAAGMRSANPAFIPRNHRVEAALNAASAGDYQPFHQLLAILQRPYEEQPAAVEFSHAPEPSERVLETFCGT